MSSTYLHPSLDSDGWISASVKVADSMLSDFFLCDFSQTAHFPNDVASFAYLLQRYQGSVQDIARETQRTLSNYFSKQFRDVEIEVSPQDQPDSINLKALNIVLVFTDTEGVVYNLSRIVNYTGLKVTDIFKAINFSE